MTQGNPSMIIAIIALILTVGGDIFFFKKQSDLQSQINDSNGRIVDITTRTGSLNAKQIEKVIKKLNDVNVEQKTEIIRLKKEFNRLSKYVAQMAKKLSTADNKMPEFKLQQEKKTRRVSFEREDSSDESDTTDNESTDESGSDNEIDLITKALEKKNNKSSKEGKKKK